VESARAFFYQRRCSWFNYYGRSFLKGARASAAAASDATTVSTTVVVQTARVRVSARARARGSVAAQRENRGVARSGGAGSAAQRSEARGAAKPAARALSAHTPLRGGLRATRNTTATSARCAAAPPAQRTPLAALAERR
jgi:hypothetical protein